MHVVKDIVHATAVIVVINFARGCRSFDNLMESDFFFPPTNTRHIHANAYIYKYEIYASLL